MSHLLLPLLCCPINSTAETSSLFDSRVHSCFNLLQFHLSLVRTEILDGDTEVVCRPIRWGEEFGKDSNRSNWQPTHCTSSALHLLSFSIRSFHIQIQIQIQPPCYCIFTHHYTVQRCGKWYETCSDVIQRGAVTYVSYRGGARCQKREMWPKMFPIETPGYQHSIRGNRSYLKKVILATCRSAPPVWRPLPTRLSKTHLQSLDPREPRLVKLLPRGIHSKVGKMGESITVALLQGMNLPKQVFRESLFLDILISWLLSFFEGNQSDWNFRFQRVNC